MRRNPAFQSHQAAVRWPLAMATAMMALGLALAAQTSHGQTRMEQLQNYVNERVLASPAQIHVAQYLEMSDQSRWGLLYLLASDLHPAVRQLALTEGGWRPDDSVTVLISPQFDRTVICPREAPCWWTRQP